MVPCLFSVYQITVKDRGGQKHRKVRLKGSRSKVEVGCHVSFWCGVLRSFHLYLYFLLNFYYYYYLVLLLLFLILQVGCPFDYKRKKTGSCITVSMATWERRCLISMATSKGWFYISMAIRKCCCCWISMAARGTWVFVTMATKWQPAEHPTYHPWRWPSVPVLCLRWQWQLGEAVD